MKKAKYITATRRQRGFTMIELMITVTLVAILASIAAPSMRTYVLNNRLNSASQEFLRTLQTARSEATKRQRNVVVCASANPQATDTTTITCTTGTPSGWIMFEENTTPDWDRASTEALIEVHTYDANKMQLLANNSKRVSYTPTGFATVNGGAAPQIRSTGVVVCDSRGNVDSSGGSGAQSVARGIVILGTGRARITKVLSDITGLLGSATC